MPRRSRGRAVIALPYLLRILSIPNGGEIMKAMRYHSYGESGVLVYEEADRPVAGSGQVVVQVAGAAFNPVDVAIRAGFVQQVFPVDFPYIPGFDVAGVVAETGAGVT